MPELPDIAIYVERLRGLFAGQSLERIELRSPFALRTVQPDLFSAEGRRVVDFHRQAKRIVWELEGELWFVFHLMIAGRFHQKTSGTRPRGKNDLAAFHFPDSTLMLTEVSKKHRAAIYCFADTREIDRLDRGGIEPLVCTVEQFRAVLVGDNHTLKRSLTDPRLFSGIGNAYSDEILHAARLSPIKLTSKLTEDEIGRLHSATSATLTYWIDLLRKQVGDGFPERVIAFRPEMAVHGRFGQPCRVCRAPVQRIVYADNETNYCPKCQTGGRLLADRSLSRLLKDDWPRTLEHFSD